MGETCALAARCNNASVLYSATAYGAEQPVRPNILWISLEDITPMMPIKTMNFMPKTNSFQVDTGPILVPDYE